jgi:hypothetical protein
MRSMRQCVAASAISASEASARACAPTARRSAIARISGVPERMRQKLPMTALIRSPLICH